MRCDYILFRYNKDMWDPFTLDALTAAFMAERETRTSVRGEQRTAESCADAIDAQDAKAAAEDSE